MIEIFLFIGVACTLIIVFDMAQVSYIKNCNLDYLRFLEGYWIFLIVGAAAYLISLILFMVKCYV